jgi:hypothetical protein
MSLASIAFQAEVHACADEQGKAMTVDYKRVGKLASCENGLLIITETDCIPLYVFRKKQHVQVA